MIPCVVRSLSLCMIPSPTEKKARLLPISRDALSLVTLIDHPLNLPAADHSQLCLP